MVKVIRLLQFTHCHNLFWPQYLSTAKEICSTKMSETCRYSVTGAVAKERIAPLLPVDWIDIGEEGDNENVPDFLWENAPRRETKAYRDIVKVYSHLPNGTSVLDSKWALGRLFASCKDPMIGSLETHCFRGLDGFQDFAERINLLGRTSDSENLESRDTPAPEDYPDIMNQAMNLSSAPDPKYGPKNLWVVKDAMANGAGGIWVVGPENARSFVAKETSPLYSGHKYVAQRYAWPPVLFGGRKCHVRVYGLLTSDGRAYVHHRAFLHVANDPFTTKDANDTGLFQDSIHITNCCANSHDDAKFAGEILADFEQSEYTRRDDQMVVPLAAFFPSVSRCIAFISKQGFPFLNGGDANHGFEYLGIDFMLSYGYNREPIAHLLEINAPPSQDSATGLPHAENLHNDVIRDLMTLWVLPHVTRVPANLGGWRCVYSPETIVDDEEEPIIPSKAAIINKIRWSMFEKKAQREQDDIVANAQTRDDSNGTTTTWDPMQISTFARSKFPFFSDATTTNPAQVFFENAGGSQVAQSVIDAVSSSLRFRHRSKVGTKSKQLARRCLSRLLGARDDETLVLGPNATTLLASLADQYIQSGLLTADSEIVLSVENHAANFDPWVRAAKSSGATIKLWSPWSREVNSSARSSDLTDLLTENTQVVAIPHASNVLGQIRDLQSLTALIKEMTRHKAHVVVDGVAAAPHHFADLANHSHVDWYVVSCHKLFGPHIGGMFGRRGTAHLLSGDHSPTGTDNDTLYKLLERGTLNYEACAGVVGLGEYFAALASFPEDFQFGMENSDSNASMDTSQPLSEVPITRQPSMLTIQEAKEAYRRIDFAEAPLLTSLLRILQKCKHIRIIESDETLSSISTIKRLPTVSFFHAKIPPQTIVSACEAQGISCRGSSFLCTPHLATEFGFDHVEGVVRISLAHYNTHAEIDRLLQLLECLPDWL